ncbi:MAG TPA: ABC transporter substrate-binding protein [Burkholderiales bacterium]|nr:ABC transporter substrate-binding protein [Burkholderiales bacterium]
MKTLRLMASRHSVFYSPLLATFAGGFLQEEGLDASYRPVPAGRSVGEFLASGEIDVTQSAVSYSWSVLEKGGTPPAVNFAHVNVRDGFFIAARSAQAGFTFERLLSGRLMYVHGGQPEAMLRYALHRNGVDLSSVTGVDAGNTEQMMDAFRRGEADYFHEQAPYPQQLEHEGIAHVVAAVGEAIGPVSFSTLAATPAWLKEPDAVKFMRAFRKARAWVQGAPAAEIAQRLAYLFPNISEHARIKGIEAYQRLGCWEGDPEIRPEHYEAALDVFQHAGLISRRYPSAGIVVRPPDVRG